MESVQPDLSCLRRLRPLVQFSDEQLQSLANQLELKTSRKGEKLIELGCSEAFSLFVLEGEVNLIARDGKSRQIKVEKNQQLNPIAQLRPCMYDVVALQSLKYLKVDRDLLTEFAQLTETGEEDISVHLIETDDDTADLTMHLYQDLMSDNISLLSLPEVASKIQQAFQDENIDMQQISRILLTDPAMTGKLIKVANSPVYQGVAPADTLSAAIIRLGMDTTYKLVMAYALNELFVSKSPAAAKRMERLWSHSRKVAAISRVLASKTKLFDPEQAMLAGLIHDLGIIVILDYLAEHDAEFADDEKMESTIKVMRPQITGILMQKWNFSEDIITVAEECEDWFRHPRDDADLCDLVLIAQYHSMMGTPEMQGLPPITTLPAMTKLNMGPAESIELIKQSRSEIAEIERLLH